MSMPNKWAHLVKPLEVKPGPPGLYQQPRFWAEAKDWEGYNGNFSFGFFTEPCVNHPIVGAVVHPYDEVLVFAGTELADIRALGGEMSIELGEEREEHIFDEPTVVCIPRGLPHGQVRVRTIGFKAIAHYHFGLSGEYQAETIPESARPRRKTTGQKYAHLLKPLRTYMPWAQRRQMDQANTDPAYEARMEAAAKKRSKTGATYQELTDGTGVIFGRDVMGPGNSDQLIWLFGQDIQNFELNFTWGFFSGTGIWHRVWEGHAHPEPEALIFVGLNPYDMNYLGAEIEFGLGSEFERHVLNRPSAIIAPAGFVHLPCITRWADDSYAFIAACLGAEHQAPWVNPEDLE
jgi:hypothetical protein